MLSDFNPYFVPDSDGAPVVAPVNSKCNRCYFEGDPLNLFMIKHHAVVVGHRRALEGKALHCALEYLLQVEARIARFGRGKWRAVQPCDPIPQLLLVFLRTVGALAFQQC